MSEKAQAGWYAAAGAITAAGIAVWAAGFSKSPPSHVFEVYGYVIFAIGLLVILWATYSGRSLLFSFRRRRRRASSSSGGWRLMGVRACSPGDVGVRAAMEPGATLPPYVERDHDDRLKERLSAAELQGGFVLLLGSSSCGKTRSLLEAVQAVLADWRVLIPESPAAVRQALSVGDIRSRTIVWLDDTPVERFITVGNERPDSENRGLNGDDFRRIMAVGRPVVIVDSMWPSRHQVLAEEPRPPGGTPAAWDPSRKAREVLALAGDPIRIETEFSGAERFRARELAHRDDRLAAALRDRNYGVTQALAGAPALISRYRDADDAEPFAFAVMTAAIDARRLGCNDPLSKDFLQAAMLGYLPQWHLASISDSDRERATARFVGALAYATDIHANAGHVAPLIPSVDSSSEQVGYTVADYLLEHVQEQRRHVAVPSHTWEALLNYTNVQVDLARWLFENGRIHELRNRADAGDNRAQELLAEWLVQDDRTDELRLRAEDGDDVACRRLADLLHGNGKVDHAITLIRPLAEAGHGAAMRSLAEWSYEQGRLDDAVSAIRPLVVAGDAGARQLMASWLYEQNRVQEAIAAIRPLADAGDSDARRLLATWLADDEWIYELRTRAFSGDDIARRRLAAWLYEHDGVAEAIETIRPLADAGDSSAGELLARWLYEHDGVAEAIETIRPLADAGDHSAQQILARWLCEQNSIHELRKRADAGDLAARSQLAGWLLAQGRVSELRQRADTGDDQAKWVLATWLFDNDGIGEIRQRSASGDDTARLRLAIRLYEQNQVRAAIDEIRPLADAGDETAAKLLASWLWERRDAGDDLTGEEGAGI